jgi:spermidine/putrescine transport system substrate-binding protein
MKNPESRAIGRWVLVSLLVAGWTSLAADRSLAAGELNALIWCDHADPALLQPFEEANGVKVNVKEFEGTGAGLAIVEQSQPGDWDVMVIDSVDVRRGVEKGLFEPLPDDQLPIADLFPEVLMDSHTKIDGKRLASPRSSATTASATTTRRLIQRTCSRWRRCGIRNTRAGSRFMTITCR